MEDVRRYLEDLSRHLADELAGCATVDRSDGVGPGFIMTTIEPTKNDALTVVWMEFYGTGIKNSSLQVEAGTHGGRWELTATLDDARFLADVTRAVVEGRVVETFGPGRSKVQVTLASGEVVEETGYQTPRGCLPIPGWVRRGRKVSYSAYR